MDSKKKASLRFGQSLWAQLADHQRLLFDGLDPVKDRLPKKKPSRNITNPKQNANNLPNRIHFLVPIAVNLFVTVQSFVWYFNEEVSFSHSRRFLTHQIFPRASWFYTDVIMLFGMCSVGANWVTLLTTSALGSECFWYRRRWPYAQIAHPQMLSQDETKRIQSFRPRAKRAIKALVLIWLLCLELYFTRQMALNGVLDSQLLGSVYLCLFWFALAPIYYFYAIYCNLVMMAYFVLTTMCFHARQRTLLERCESLLQSEQQSISIGRILSLRSKWNHLNRQLGGSSHFWRPYVTYFHLLYACYLIYSLYILILTTVTTEQALLFAYLAIYSTTFMACVMHQCSKVVRNGARIATRFGALYRARIHLSVGNLAENNNPKNKKFNQRLLVVKAQTQYQALPGLNCVNTNDDKHHPNQLLHHYRLLNDHRLDSQTFLLALYHLSVFFMLNFRPQLWRI